MAKEPRQTDAVIKITPEMIEAGVNALILADPRFNSESERVLKVFHAMVFASGGR